MQTQKDFTEKMKKNKNDRNRNKCQLKTGDEDNDGLPSMIYKNNNIDSTNNTKPDSDIDFVNINNETLGGEPQVFIVEEGLETEWLYS